MSLLDGFRWSYSKLDTAASCPFAFKKTYLDHVPDDNNPFAQAGTLCHDLLASYALGKLACYDLLPTFEKRYRKEVKAAWPSFSLNMEERTYEKIASYFRTFSGFSFARVLMVEEKLIGTVAGRPFSGIMDLVVRDHDGRIIIIDHKSSGISEYRGRKLARHKKQLFLYAHLLRQCCGIQADAVAFNLFKENQWIELPWTELDEADAISWAGGIMGAVEGLSACFFDKLPALQQTIQLLRMEGKSPSAIRKELHLSPRRFNRLMMEMDEAALLMLGRKEPAGDFGCQFICSARQHCEEGRAV